jgi:putative peptidoglycan lipid II flippase
VKARSSSDATTAPASSGFRGRSSLAAIALVTGLQLLQLGVQLGIQLVVARRYGAGEELDAYVAALAWPTVVATILSGAVGYVLIPAVARQRSEGDPHGSALVASQLGWYLLLVSLLVWGGTTLAAGPIIAVSCPGFSAPQQRAAARLLRILGSLILLNSLTSFLNALHHATQQFFRPAVAGVVGTLVTLAWLGTPVPQRPIDDLAWAVVAGSCVTVLILVPPLVVQLGQTGAWARPLAPATREAIWLWLPLVVGALCWRLDPLVDRWAGSYLAAGSLSHLGYAWRLVQALSQIGTSGLAIVIFPVIATHAANDQHGQLARELAYGVRLLLVLVVPMCVGLGWFARPVVAFLFERGAFQPADTQAVSWLVVAYLGSVLGMGAGDLFSRTLYARNDTRTPVLVHTLAFVLAAAGKVALVSWLGASAIATATALMYLLNAAVLAAILRQQLGAAMLEGVPRCVGETVGSSVLGCLAAWGIVSLAGRWAVPAAMLAGGAGYALALGLLGNEFIHVALRRVQRLVGMQNGERPAS